MTLLGERSAGRQRLWAIALSAAALTLAGLVAAPPSQANVRFGVNKGAGTRTASEIQRMAQGNVADLRVNFATNPVNPDPMALSDDYDELVRQTARQRIPLLPVLGGFYNNGAYGPPNDAGELQNYRQALTALTERYGRDGTFWCQSPSHIPIGSCSDDYRPIVSWQVWNEPNLDYFWSGAPNAEQYAFLLEESQNALHAGDDRARVVLAGMPPKTGAGINMGAYLKDFYDVRGVKNDFDVVAIHPYAADEDGVEGGLYLVQKWLDNNGDEGRDVWITEVGWGTDGTPANEANGFVKSLSGQARVLRRTFSMTEENERRYDVERVMWFDWRDSVPPPGQSNQFYYNSGLFKRSGEPKPSWDAFTDFTGGSDGSGPLVATASQPRQKEAAALADPTPAPDELVPTPTK